MQDLSPEATTEDNYTQMRARQVKPVSRNGVSSSIDNFGNQNSAKIIPGNKKIYTASYAKFNINTNLGILLVSKDNASGAWPHPYIEGQEIQVLNYWFNYNIVTAADFVIQMGFITDQQPTTGSLRVHKAWDFLGLQKDEVFNDRGRFGLGASVNENNLFGLVESSNILGANDILDGPDLGNYNCKDGDYVVLATRNDRACSISFMVNYIMI